MSIIKNRAFRIVAVMFIAMFIMSMSVTTAFAAWDIDTEIANKNYTTTGIDTPDIEKYAAGAVTNGDQPSSWTASNAKELERILRNANKGLGATGATPIAVGDKKYYVDDTGLQKAKNYMAATAKKLDVKASVNGMGTNFSVAADTETAGVALQGLEQVISVIVGILCYAVTLGMTLFTSLDICYITMPVFRNKCEDMKQSGNGAMTKTNKETGETQLRWITDEAIYSVQSCSIETGKNPLTVYLKKRIIAFVMLAIVLFILFTGNIQLIVNIAINFISGLMDALGSLGA